MRLSRLQILAIWAIPTYLIFDLYHRTRSGQTFGEISTAYVELIEHVFLGTTKGIVVTSILGAVCLIGLLSLLSRLVKAKPLNVEEYMQEEYGIKVSPEDNLKE
jgi:hypothetical protein